MTKIQDRLLNAAVMQLECEDRNFKASPIMMGEHPDVSMVKLVIDGEDYLMMCKKGS